VKPKKVFAAKVEPGESIEVAIRRLDAMIGSTADTVRTSGKVTKNNAIALDVMAELSARLLAKAC
jgi:hypothetical protein